MEKRRSSVYSTLFGGYSGVHGPNGEISKNNWEYTCLYGKLRICHDNYVLKDNWKHFSIHWNNVLHKNGIAWNFHIAYRSKAPYILVGFKNIKHLYYNN